MRRFVENVSESVGFVSAGSRKRGSAVLLGWLVAGFLVFAPLPVRAEETSKGRVVAAGTETEAEQSKVYMKIGEIVVSEKAGYLKAADIPVSADVIGADQVETQNVDFSMELLKKVPGTYFGDWNQGVISGTISMRGFDANHDVPVTLIVDGLPHNFGYGRMDIQPFFPLEIDRMEVVKGTFDARYGLSNIAGNVNVATKNGGNETIARLLTGSFNTFDGSIVTSKSDDHFSQTYFAGYRKTDGYRDHSDLKKGAASGKWFYTPGDGNLTLGVIARFFGMDANAPGYLTKEQAEQTPEMCASFARTDGGTQNNEHVSFHLDYKPSKDLAWSFKTYAQDLERTRWARWSDAGTQQERYTDDKQYGAVSTLSYELENAGIPKLKIDWGLDFQYQGNLDMRWNTVDRVRQGDAVRDWSFDQSSWGTYVQADGDITDWLRLLGALRVDSFGGEFENRLVDRKTDMLDLDFILQPKIGTIVTPVKGYSFYANWGRTFQLPGSPQLFGQDAAGNEISRDLDESANDGWEAGFKVSPFSWLSARLDYWAMTATDEVRDKKDGSGDYINSGETDRKGWDVTLTVRPHDGVSLWASYSRVEAVYTDPGPGLADRKGKDIENIPDYAAKLGVDVKHPAGVFGSLWLESQGKYYVDPQNLKPREGDYNVWNMSLGYTKGIATFGVECKNLLDETYNAFVWNDTYGFSPGDERSFYVWATIEY